MKLKNIIFLMILFAAVIPTTGCFIYHKPEFTGQILDKETKQPIEGAVVVAVYNKEAMGLGAGANTEIINVREALTDNSGKFRIPSYTTLIVPIFPRESNATFVIFKPGYASIAGLNLEEYLSKEKGKEVELPLLYSSTAKIRLSSGVVALPKLITWDERNKADMISPTDDKSIWPLLHEMIEKEEEWLKNNKGWRR